MKIVLLLATIAFFALFFGCVSQEHLDEKFSVEIEGQEMKQMTVAQVANLWGINETKLLNAIIQDYNLQGKYNINNTLDQIREEYPFSPAMIKQIAEDIKQEKR